MEPVRACPIPPLWLFVNSKLEWKAPKAIPSILPSLSGTLYSSGQKKDPKKQNKHLSQVFTCYNAIHLLQGCSEHVTCITHHFLSSQEQSPATPQGAVKCRWCELVQSLKSVIQSAKENLISRHVLWIQASVLSDQKEDWDHLLTTMKPRGIHHEAWTETEESKHQPDDPVSSGPRPALPTGPCHSQGIPQHTSEIPHGTSRKLTEKTQAFYH